MLAWASGVERTSHRSGSGSRHGPADSAQLGAPHRYNQEELAGLTDRHGEFGPKRLLSPEQNSEPDQRPARRHDLLQAACRRRQVAHGRGCDHDLYGKALAVACSGPERGGGPVQTPRTNITDVLRNSDTHSLILTAPPSAAPIRPAVAIIDNTP